MIYSRKNKRDGTTYWYIRYYAPDGKRRKELAGTSKKDAQELYITRRSQIIDRTYVDPREVDKDKGPTFGEFADQFEQHARKRSDHYAQQLKFARTHFEGRRLREITSEDLDAFRRECLTGKHAVGASSTRKRLLALQRLFKIAKRWKVIPVNPADDLEKPPEPKGRNRYLTRDEWTKLHEAAEPWLRPLLTLAVASGMRLGEVVGLTWENVDRAAGLLHVSEENKTGNPRPVRLTATVRQVLDAQVRHMRSPFVFVNQYGNDYTDKKSRNRISKRTVAAAKAAKLSGVTFHTLRHTAGSWMAQAGRSAVEIARVLGHATTATTDRYMHLAPDHLKGPAEAIDAVLSGLDGPVSDPRGGSAGDAPADSKPEVVSL